jgi:hypothetical protein
VILTNKPNKCQNATNFNCGLSDYHNLISVQLKGEIPNLKKDYVTYRSFKNFDHEKFLQELQSEQLDVITEHSNVETAYHNFEATFIKVVDKNIPLKKRRYITHPAAFMNKGLGQEIYKKCMLHNKFLKQKTNKNWEAYRKQRNFVNKLEKKSVQKYFYERCAGGPKSSDFWPTIKPFLSSKGVKTNNSITLSENNEIVNDPKKVSDIFNDFFINVAKNIGNPNTVIDENHPSRQATNTDTLTFKPLTSTFVDKQINKLNIKKQLVSMAFLQK